MRSGARSVKLRVELEDTRGDTQLIRLRSRGDDDAKLFELFELERADNDDDDDDDDMDDTDDDDDDESDDEDGG